MEPPKTRNHEVDVIHRLANDKHLSVHASMCFLASSLSSPDQAELLKSNELCQAVWYDWMVRISVQTPSITSQA